MLRPKVTGLFIEISEFGMLAIKTSSLVPPFAIEAVYESPLLDATNTQSFIRSLSGASKNQLSAANCVFYPRKRFLCKAELENPMKGRDDPHYFQKLLRDKFRIETEGSIILVINPHDGNEFGLPPLPKEVLFCGAPAQEIELWQNTFIDCAIYPERLEMGTLSGLGGFLDYCAFTQIKDPILWIELSSEGMIAVIVKQNKIDNVRFIPLGLDCILKALQEKLNIADLPTAHKVLMEGNSQLSELAPFILGPLVKDLQSFVSFYELQYTTQLKTMAFTLLPSSLSWIRDFLSKGLSISLLELNYSTWLAHKSIQVPTNAKALNGGQWLNLCSLMLDYSPQAYA